VFSHVLPKRIDHWILLIAILTLPFFYLESKKLPSNNDVQTWLPVNSAVRDQYELFKADFGNDDFVILGLDTSKNSPEAIEAIARRIEHLPVVKTALTSEKIEASLTSLGMAPEEIDRRLNGLSRSRLGTHEAVLVSPESRLMAQDPRALMNGIHEVLAYCNVSEKDVLMAGGPVIVEELDRLGGREANEIFFTITLLISALILYVYLRDVPLTIGIMVITIWSISLNLAVVKWFGGEMNFIMGSLSVMVMVFTIANAIHVVHYYLLGLSRGESLRESLWHAAQPFMMAAITTVIGLCSLGVSEIVPVNQFGYSASVGCMISIFAALVFVPALLLQLDLTNAKARFEEARAGFDWYVVLLRHRNKVVFASLAIIIVGSLGLPYVETRIEPLDFLPNNSKAKTDLAQVEKHFAPVDVIEMVVDFDGEKGEFLDKLRVIQELHKQVSSHQDVMLVTSAATMFPSELPADLRGVSQMLKNAQSMQGENIEYVTPNHRFWRLSARIDERDVGRQQTIINQLAEMTKDHHVTFTGLTPLLKTAQLAIFHGFWESFGSAFLLISVIMVLGLRSFWLGFMAMLPNVTPVSILFGILGWVGTPLDIGMMMTASIALGISVDGTFHFMVNYRHALKQIPGNRTRAAHYALQEAGSPIIQAAVISSLGMLALTFSTFGPTFRFGMMMAAMLMTALLGSIIFLPAILCLGCRGRIDEALPAPATILSFLASPPDEADSDARPAETKPVAAAG